MALRRAKSGAMRRWGAIALRIVLAVLGGYATAASLVAALASVLATMAGMARSEAALLAAMLGYLIYLLVGLWGFSERSLLRLSVGLAVLVALSGFVVAAVRIETS